VLLLRRLPDVLRRLLLRLLRRLLHRVLWRMLLVLTITLVAAPPAQEEAGIDRPAPPAVAPQVVDPAPAARPLEFAESLYRQELYAGAELEFRRVAHTAADPLLRWQARSGLVSCLLARKGYPRAIELLGTLEASAPTVADRFEVRVREGRALGLVGDPALAAQRLGLALRLAEEHAGEVPPALVNTARAEQVLAFVELERFVDAAGVADLLAREGAAPADLAPRLRAAPETLPHLPPALLGAMSALVPGSGQIVAGRVTDGLVALALVGAFAAGAVGAFDSEQYVVGGIVSFFGLGWYSGNVYGALNAAERHNRDAKLAFREEVVRDLASPVPVPGGAP